jgi:hypothetical protein
VTDYRRTGVLSHNREPWLRERSPVMPSPLPRLRFSGDWQAAAQSLAERLDELIPFLAETLRSDLEEAGRGVPGAREQVETTVQRVLGACIGYLARSEPTQTQKARIEAVRRAARFTLVQLGRARLDAELR